MSHVAATDRVVENPVLPSVSSIGALRGAFGGLLLGLIAGALAWALLSISMPAFSVPSRLYDTTRYYPAQPPNSFWSNLMAAERATEGLNTSYAAGLLGLCLGAVLGFASGAARRSFKLAIAGGVGGGLVTMLAAALGGFMSHCTRHGALFDLRFVGPSARDFIPVFEYSLATSWLFLALGMGAAISMTIFSQQRWQMARAMLVAAIAGLAVAAIFPFAHLSLFKYPAYALIPNEPSALALWCLLACGSVAACCARRG